jgi:tripeptidyl-peptidase I
VGVFEQGSVYIPHDLDKFFAKYAPNVPHGTRPTLESIEGATLALNRSTRILAGEANIDLDIIYSLTYPQTVTCVYLSAALE